MIELLIQVTFIMITASQLQKLYGIANTGNKVFSDQRIANGPNTIISSIRTKKKIMLIISDVVFVIITFLCLERRIFFFFLFSLSFCFRFRRRFSFFLRFCKFIAWSISTTRTFWLYVFNQISYENIL